MKRYKDYMDGVGVSDTLHEKLKHLEEPKKQSQPWVKWGAMAAAFALVVGAGVWGLNRGGWNALMDNFRPNGGWDDLTDHFDPAAGTVEADREEIGEPDIAFEDPDIPMTLPGETPPKEPFVDYGYGLVDGNTVSYYFLPDLNWADASAQPQTAADYALAPPSAISRGASLDDVRAFAGGEKAMADHLLWDGLDWGGLFWFLENGTPQAAALYADGHNLHFLLEVMKGGKVPSCIVFPDEYYEKSQWQGVEITAVKNGGYMVTDGGVELNEKREVSFFYDGVGYKLTLYADDAYRADELCARFVRYAVSGVSGASGGFHLDVLSTDGVLDCSYYSVGEPNWEDSETGEFVSGYDPAYEDGVPEEDSGIDGFYCDCPDCIAGTVHTHPYDPGADIVVTAPPYSADN